MRRKRREGREGSSTCLSRGSEVHIEGSRVLHISTVEGSGECKGGELGGRTCQVLDCSVVISKNTREGVTVS